MTLIQIGFTGSIQMIQPRETKGIKQELLKYWQALMIILTKKSWPELS